MLDRNSNIMATKAGEELYAEIRNICPDAVYHALAKVITIKNKAIEMPDSYIAVVTAGTSNLPVAEAAAVASEFFRNRVEKIADVGVAGIHRLFRNMEAIRAGEPGQS